MTGDSGDDTVWLLSACIKKVLRFSLVRSMPRRPGCKSRAFRERGRPLAEILLVSCCSLLFWDMCDSLKF